MDTKKTWCVYMHRSPSNKAYIGITSKKPEKRWDNGNGYKKQSYFWRAICKYGWDNIEHIIFMDNLSKSEACHIEQLLIQLFDTQNSDFGYNYQPGGETGNYGCKMSDETRKKVSESKKGRKATAEERLKLSIAQKERWTEDERRQRSKKYSGNGNPMHGVHRYGEDNPMYCKKHSDEAKNKMSKTKLESPNESRIPVVCVETGVIYSSTYDVERQTGICQQNVAACCRHEKHRKTAGGYRWEYIVCEEAV